MRELGIWRGIRDGARVTEALTRPITERAAGPLFHLAAGKAGTVRHRIVSYIYTEYKAAKEDEERRKK